MSKNHKAASRPLEFPLDRVKAFTDGVMAIIVTILVLEIETPELGRSRAEHIQFLVDLFKQLHPYFASFILVSTFWIQHLMVSRFLNRVDRTFLWLNILYLIPLSLSPFLTSLRVLHTTSPLAEGLFGLALAISSLLALWMWRYACHERRLVDADLDPELVRHVSQRILAVCVASVVGALVATVHAHLGSLVFVSIPFLLMLIRSAD